ncbi:putative post-transcriptional gene silencing PAZ-Argonaute family protein [Helianthus annuus]|nr:putative post-transcriptional gene silencing PAZ-Argonaute family protein [Helianthus annuus]
MLEAVCLVPWVLFHSSFRTSQGGLSLNIVVDFLIANQNVKDPYSVDWAKAKRTLKNLRVKNNETNTEYKITGLSEKPCNQQLRIFFSHSFSLRQQMKDENGEFETMEMTVYDYFVNYRKMDLRYSGDLPCINVGKPKKPIFLPIEEQKCGFICLINWVVFDE